MDILERKKKKPEFYKLYLSGKYTQKQISTMIGVSEQTLVEWAKEIPMNRYINARVNLAKELERLSLNPKDNEQLIFQYIKHLDILENIIKKTSFVPK